MQFNAKFTTRKISSADDFAIGCHFHFDNYINKVQVVFDAGRRRLQLKATYRNLSVGLKACLLQLCQNVTIIHGFNNVSLHASNLYQITINILFFVHRVCKYKII